MILINRTILYFLIFVTAIFSTTSCSFNEFQDPSTIVDIAKEIELRLVPDLQNDSRLEWLITTKDNKYCHDAILHTEIVDVPSRYELQIQGIDNPANCQPFNAYVSSTEKFNPVDNARFQIIFPNNLTSEISIIREDNRFVLASSDQEYFSFTQQELQLFNKLTFWAGINTDSDEEYEQFSALITSIKNSYQSNNLPFGNYGYIRKIADQEIVVNPQTLLSYDQALSFQMSDEIDYTKVLDQVQTAIAEYRLQNPEQDFFIATSLGDVL